MNLNLRPFLLALILTPFFAALPGRVVADTVEFPKKHPVFSVEVPEGWTSKFSDDRTLTLRKEDEDVVKAVVIFGDGLKGVHDEATVREVVPVQAEATAKAAKLTELKEKHGLAEFPMTDEIKAVGAEYSCKSGESLCIYQVFVFPIGGSHYYTAEVNMVASAAAETKEDRHAILHSLEIIPQDNE